jgi:hypothetical protein
LRLIASANLFEHVLSLKDGLSSYWFVVPNNRIMATSANKTRLLAITRAAVRVVMNKVWKRYVLENGADVEEAVEVNPFTAIH